MKPAAFFALLCACLAFAGTSQAAIGVGVADNTVLGSPDGGSAYVGVLNDIGLRELRLPVKWDPARPTEIDNRRQIKALLPVAAVRGVNVAFSIQPGTATAATASPEAASRFVAFEQLVARTFPTVTDIIVGNEPNQPYFWQPQFDARGRNVSAGAYEALLAASYDALKAVNPEIDVIALGLSSRGNDDRRASGNVSTSPVKFIAGMGAAYRASGRTLPLMDELAYHPYPRRDTDPLTAGILWPNAGATNLGPRQAGGLGRVPRHGSEDVRGRPAGSTRRGGMAGGRSAADAQLLLRRRDGEADERGHSGLDLCVAGALRGVRLERRCAPLLRPAGRAEPRALAGRADAGRRVGSTVVPSRCRRCSRKPAGSASGRCASGGTRPPCKARRRPFRAAGDCRRVIRSWAFTATAGEDTRFRAGVYRLRKGRRPVHVLTERGRIEAHVTRLCASARAASRRAGTSIRSASAPKRTETARPASRAAASSSIAPTSHVRCQAPGHVRSAREAWRAASSSLAMTT